MGKKAWIILCSVLAAVVIGAQVYEIVVKGVVDTHDITRTLILLATIILVFFRKNSGFSDTRAIKKAYKRAYGELIGDAFEGKPKQEKLFYAALHNLNNRKPNAALDKLEDLQADCETVDERFAAAFFSGMCCDNLRQFESSVKHYERAASLKRIPTPLINAGFGYGELGEFELAIECQKRALDIRPDAVAYNNISQIYIETGEYEKALEYAEKSIELNANNEDSLSAAVIAHAMLGHEEEYKDYLRRCVTAGGDPDIVKRYIEMMKFEEKLN